MQHSPQLAASLPLRSPRPVEWALQRHHRDALRRCACRFEGGYRGQKDSASKQRRDATPPSACCLSGPQGCLHLPSEFSSAIIMDSAAPSLTCPMQGCMQVEGAQGRSQGADTQDRKVRHHPWLAAPLTLGPQAKGSATPLPSCDSAPSWPPCPHSICMHPYTRHLGLTSKGAESMPKTRSIQV